MRVLYGDQVLPEVRTLINDAPAGSALRLVSGYFKPEELLGKSLTDALHRGVTAVLIVRGGRSEKKHGQAVAEFEHPGLTVHYLPWLHAKLYVSDAAGITTSMNLTENSTHNKGEIAVSVRRTENPEGYRQMQNAFDHFLKEARLYALDRDAPPPKAEARVRAAVAVAVTSENDVATRGHCIRCDASVRLNREKPLCRSCYDEWAEYENPAYKEKYCHECGKETRTSIETPVCKQCYAE